MRSDVLEDYHGALRHMSQPSGTEEERNESMTSGKHGITVLIIDDDEFTRQKAKMILEDNFPYEVLTAPSGMDGVEVLLQNKVHLILLDVTMPGWTGFKTLSVIREKVLLRNIPVIMLTAAADRDSIIRASRYKVEDYIRKPFMPEELVSRVAKVVWEHWPDEGFETLSWILRNGSEPWTEDTISEM